MPELPEVETVRRTLTEHLINDTVLSVEVRYPKMVKTDLPTFLSGVKNQLIERIERIGKHLVFIFKDHVMLVHLRMEGKFYIDHHHDSKHSHILFQLKSDRQLIYHDVRKFGTFHWLPKEDYREKEPIKSIALEPKDMDPVMFYETISSKKREIKPVLLDQTIISGLGNIYVDETLFLSGIHPERVAMDLSFKDVELLLKNATWVLDRATELGGSSIRSYQSSLGIHGRFQNELLVHMKKGQPCPICQNPISKIKVKGRGTYVCESCQH